MASLQDRVMRGLSWGQEARRTLTSEMECRHAANRGLHREIRQVDSNILKGASPQGSIHHQMVTES